jgi:hypothetical protein
VKENSHFAVNTLFFSCFRFYICIQLKDYFSQSNQKQMKKLLIFFLFAAIQLPLFALPKLKKCTCYTEWGCYSSGDGGSTCTSSGASWMQDAGKSCGAQYFVSGTSASFMCTAPPGGNYGAPYYTDVTTMTSGSDIPPGCN